MGVGLLRLVVRAIVGTAAREGAVEVAERVTGDDLPGNFLIEAVEDFLGKSVEESTEAEVERAITELQSRGELPRTSQLAAEAGVIEEAMSTSRIEYSTWTSIAFEVAKEKGARFGTTRAEIRAGTAPTADAISLFAEIWNDRKDEMVSPGAARRIAQEEINIS